MQNRNELFDEREKLTNIMHDLSNEYDEEMLKLKKKFTPQLTKLAEKISFIRSKLHELGVPVEDC